MPNKGLRFFGTDYNNNAFGGTAAASSRTSLEEFPFDGLSGTKWTSDGEDTDGNEVTLEMDYGFNRTIDSFFIYNSNIEDVEVQYWSGSAWVTCSDSIATIVRSADLLHTFVKLDAEVTTTKVRIVGSDTITPNEEKYVHTFLAFLEIGQFQYFPDFDPENEPEQNVFKTTDGRGFVIERGESFSAKITFKSHKLQVDINLAEELRTRKEPFYIWPCGGDVSIFSYTFYPYRFQDMIKVTIVGPSKAKLTKNYYKAGYNNVLSLIEVA